MIDKAKTDETIGEILDIAGNLADQAQEQLGEPIRPAALLSLATYIHRTVLYGYEADDSSSV